MDDAVRLDFSQEANTLFTGAGKALTGMILLGDEKVDQIQGRV